MIRTICVVTACAVCLTTAVTAQPLPAPWFQQSLARASALAATMDAAPSPRQDSQAAAAGPVRSFAELSTRLKTGDTVYVIDAAGVAVKGRIATLSETLLTLIGARRRREFAAAAVRQIDLRRADSIRNGLLLGLAAGVSVGYLAGRGTDSPSCPRSGIECGQGALIGSSGGALWGALGGWAADALIHRRQVVYVAQDSRQATNRATAQSPATDSARPYQIFTRSAGAR